MSKLIRFLVIILVVLFAELSYAQTLTTQAQVDAWDQSLTSIPEGMTVTITGSDITNVDALSNLTSIEGELDISGNSALLDIDGLGNLISIVGIVKIGNGFNGNESLININGLLNLTSIEGELSISNNGALTNIDGLSNLESIFGSLYITGNSSLTNIDAFDDLTSIDGELLIIGNHALNNINGLVKVTSIAGVLKIGTFSQGNDALTNIDGLSNLISITGTLELSECNSLTNIDALSNLTNVEGLLKVSGNPVLADLNGLDNLIGIDGSLEILGNESLLNIDALSGVASIDGVLIISRNAAMMDIDAFIGLSSIEGTLDITSNQSLQNINGLSNLTSITGVLNIGFRAINTGNSVLNDLNGLRNLTSLEGTLVIGDNDALTNIDGLSNLASIEGELIISNNGALTNIDALSNHTSIEGTLIISYNEVLPNIDGLTNLTSIDGFIIIAHNSSLVNIDGFRNLTSLEGGLTLDENNALTNINGLLGLTTLYGRLKIYKNLALTSINGLSNLTSINGSLIIERNHALTNVDGLVNVRHLIGELTIWKNGILDNLDGLKNLESIEGFLSIHRNYQLTRCCAISHLLPEYIWKIQFVENPSPCSFNQEVYEECLNISVEQNAPCINLDNGSLDVHINNYDSIPFSYILERQEDGSVITGISQENYFNIGNLSAGTYNITVTTPAPEVIYRNDIILSEVDGSAFEVIEVHTNHTVNGLANGNISLTISGGTPPFRLFWSGTQSGSLTGVNSNVLMTDNLLGGDYTIIVSDSDDNELIYEVTLIDETIPLDECSEPLDIVILNLVSYAINAQEYKESKEYFLSFLESANIGEGSDENRAAIVEWSAHDLQDIKIPISGNIQDLKEYSNKNRSFDKGTDIIDALLFARTYLNDHARPDAKKVIIFTYDGCPGFSASALAGDLKNEGFIIADIGIDYVNASSYYRGLLTEAATTRDLAYFAPGFADLDPLTLRNYLYLSTCDIGSSKSYFHRDGALEIKDIVTASNCPDPERIEITFTVEALEDLSIPGGTSVSFYHNNPELFAASPISTFLIPCDIPAGEIDTFVYSMPLDHGSHIFAVLNDDARQAPAFSLPVTDLLELTYENNVDSRRICVDDEATLQALKSTTTPTPICDSLVVFNVDVCNISNVDAFGVVIDDQPGLGFSIVDSLFNNNGCSTYNSGTYDIPSGCCVSLIYTYNTEMVDDGYYTDLDVYLSGPTNQTYVNFEGDNTTSEDVFINGDFNCNDAIISFEKAVNHTTTCEDHSLTYTFTITNESDLSIQNVWFRDSLPHTAIDWIYKPYDIQNISITNAPFLDGQVASFIIDEIDAKTSASFSIDVYVGPVESDVVINNTAVLSGLPEYFNKGEVDISSNTVSTTILADREITIADTIYSSVSENNIILESLISGSGDLHWTTSGDGYFTDENNEVTTYHLGPNDLLDTVLSLFIEVQTYCGEKGQAVTIIRECDLKTTNIDVFKLCPNMTGEDQVVISWLGGVGPYGIKGAMAGNDITSPYSISSLDEGMQVFTLYDTLGCSLNFDVNIEVHDTAQINYTSVNSTCAMSDGSFDLEIIGDGPFDISGDLIMNDVIDDVLFENVDQGTYQITIKDAQGCQASHTIIMREENGIDSLLLTFANPMCFGESSGNIELLEVYGGSAPFINYLNGSQISTDLVDDLSSGEYTLIVEDNNGCKYDELITLQSPEEVLLSVIDKIIVEFMQNTTVELQTNINSDQIDTIIWNPDIDCDNCLSAEFVSVENDQTYEVTLIDENGCSVTKEFEIIVQREDDESKVYLPNVIYGRSVAGNHIFYPQSGSDDILIDKLQIFDRGGTMVFGLHNFPINNEAFGWDGMIKGKEAALGVYAYILTYTIDGQQKTLVGDVMLMW